MVYAALRRLIKHSAIYALGPAVQKLLGFVLLPFITAYIGTSATATTNYGVLELGTVTIAIAAQVLGVNLLHGMTRFYGDYETQREKGALVTTTLILLGTSTLLALGLAWILRGPAARLVFGSSEYEPVVVCVFAILFFQTIGQVGLRWLQILERSVTYGVLTTIKLLIEVPLKIWLLYIGLMYMGAFYSTLACEALIAAVLFGFIVWKLGFAFSWPMAGRLWKYSRPLILSGLCGFVLHQGDRYFVQYFQDKSQVGLYSTAYKQGTIPNALFLEAFGLIWFPYVFSLKSDDEIRALCRKVLTYFNLLMCTASLFLAVFSREIVARMTASEFHEAWPAMPIVLAGYVCWALYQVVHTVFFLRERTGRLSMLVAGAAVLNLLLDAILIRPFGYMGAAWATVATFAALAIASWIAAERIFPIRYEVGRVLAPIALGVVLYVASLWIPVDWPVWASIGVKSLAVVMLPAALLGAGYLHDEEKAKIGEIWRSVRLGRGRGSH